MSSADTYGTVVEVEGTYIASKTSPPSSPLQKKIILILVCIFLFPAVIGALPVFLVVTAFTKLGPLNNLMRKFFFSQSDDEFANPNWRAVEIEEPNGGGKYSVTVGYSERLIAEEGDSNNDSKRPVIIFLDGSVGLTGSIVRLKDLQAVFGDFDLMAYDRPGMGYSTQLVPEQSCRVFCHRTADVLADELHQVVTKSPLVNGRGPFILVASSSATFTARLFYNKHPELVRAMVLLDPTVEQRAALPTDTRAKLNQLITPLYFRTLAYFLRFAPKMMYPVMAAFAKKLLLTSGMKAAISDQYTPATQSSITDQYIRPRHLIAVADEAEQLSTSADIVIRQLSTKTIDVPVLVMSATVDTNQSDDDNDQLWKLQNENIMRLCTDDKSRQVLVKNDTQPIICFGEMEMVNQHLKKLLL